VAKKQRERRMGNGEKLNAIGNNSKCEYDVFINRIKIIVVKI
tara:strand:+ start:1009 stop:1134 length:126 start_codon:yes stop_codon:yes gene_type:complete